jgi:hypothetical protein
MKGWAMPNTVPCNTESVNTMCGEKNQSQQEKRLVPLWENIREMMHIQGTLTNFGLQK